MIVNIDYRLNDEEQGVVMLDLTLDVTEENDPYGTGDSPAQLNVEFLTCVTGNEPYDVYALHKYDVDKITKLACDKYREY